MRKKKRVNHTDEDALRGEWTPIGVPQNAKRYQAATGAKADREASTGPKRAGSIAQDVGIS